MPPLGFPASRSRRFIFVATLALLAATASCRRNSHGDGKAVQLPAQPVTVEADRFSSRVEKTDGVEHLAVSLRLRTTAPKPLDCYVFIVARTEHGVPRLWAIWPSESPGNAISVGGNFHAAHPTAGSPVTLTGSWVRVNATLPRSVGQPSFDFVVVYVVNAAGEVLLARPFPL